MKVRIDSRMYVEMKVRMDSRMYAKCGRIRSRSGREKDMMRSGRLGLAAEVSSDMK